MGEEDRYVGMFSGKRIGGNTSMKLNIIGEELSSLERGSRPLPSKWCAGPGLPDVDTLARTTISRASTSLGFRTTGRLRSGLDVQYNRERCFGTPDFACSCLLYTSPSPRDRTRSRMPSSA
eukprot:TRINITY_DN771_c0_g1_i2.p2 TRINITY_DN771_c0_g1~~TRINITY_DN771_c0_g1_i2.p2  ORF type:complete len:121 (+),score=12.33 TRINITY_DN771_c0_g1_i2:87-449(+)